MYNTELTKYFSQAEVNFRVTENDILLWFHKCEQECLRAVLTQYLGMFPTPQQVAECQKLMTPEHPNKYVFKYKDRILGTLVHHYDNMNENNRIGVEFIPATTP